MKSITDLGIDGKAVLLRLNLNVPMKDGAVRDDYRLRAVLDTVRYCHERAKKTVIIAHLGRPEGKDPSFSLKPVGEKLAELLGKEIHFIDDCVGEEVRSQIEQADEETILLLENLRFHEGERANDEGFGKELAKNGEVFINDAFGDSYNAYASVMWPPQVLPSAAGFRLQKEVNELTKLKTDPEHPFVVMIGGAKIHEKIGVIHALGKNTDAILVGGGVANTIFAANGKDVGKSLKQEDEFDEAKELLEYHAEKVILPEDVTVVPQEGDEFLFDQLRETTPDDVKSNEAILDIGPKTVQSFQEKLKDAKSVFWAGPLGYIHSDKTVDSSKELLEFLSGAQAKVYLGGGETASLLEKAQIDQFTFVATGGGAALKFLSGKQLPGLEVLDQSG